MEMWIYKIWLYGGWFYLALLLAVLFSLIWPLKRLIVFSSLILALMIGFSFYVKEIRLPCQVKLDQAAYGQIEFALQLEGVLPPSAKGCIYWSWDVPTRFLIQRLYPRRFVPIEEGAKLEKCPYIISQFKPRELVNYQLIFTSKSGYLYQRL